jgi:hypothetical protein
MPGNAPAQEETSPDEEAPAQDQTYDRGCISLNLWSASYTGDIKIKAEDVFGGTKIIKGDRLNLEDEYGLNNPQTVPEIEAWFRIGKKHRIILSYFFAHYEGDEKLEQQVEVGGLTFGVSTDLETEFTFSRFMILHQWRPIMNDRGWLGWMWGAEYYMWTIGYEGFDVFKPGIESDSDSLPIFIPVFGMEGELNLGAGFGLFGSLAGAGIDLGFVEASYSDINLGAYYEYKRLRAALGFRTIDTSLISDPDDDEDEAVDIKFSHNGLLLSVGVMF